MSTEMQDLKKSKLSAMPNLRKSNLSLIEEEAS